VRSRLVDLLERVSRLAELAVTPGAAAAASRCRPFSVSAFRLVSGLEQMGHQWRTVVDVGANAGQFSAAALAAWPGADLIAFEPLPFVAASLQARFAGRRSAEVHAVALGDTDGQVSFYPHDYSLSSSVLPVLGPVADRFAWARQGPAIQVPLRRLDAVIGRRVLARPALLKLDVQGSELAVLAGATKTLEQIDVVVVEVSFEPTYADQPLFGDVHRFFDEAGWRLARPLDWRRQDGRIVEADVAYLCPSAGLSSH